MTSGPVECTWHRRRPAASTEVREGRATGAVPEIRGWMKRRPDRDLVFILRRELWEDSEQGET